MTSVDHIVFLHDPATGHAYYADLVTGAASWERPAVLDAPAASPIVVSEKQKSIAAARRKSRSKAAAKWEEFFDDTQGLPYYFNAATGESTWVLPADDDDDEEADEEADDEAGPSQSSHAPREEEQEAAKREKALRHRERILEEIVSSEESYVAALNVLLKVYVAPLRAVADVPRGAIFSHKDLDAIFLNIEVIAKVNDKFLAELNSGVGAADALKAAARQFQGCYKRYVNNYDASEAKLRGIRESIEPGDREKQRYLNTATTHPDAKGKDVTSFLIQPVQRVLRYRLLLADLLEHTPSGHADEPAVRDAYERVCELAVTFNEDKRLTDDKNRLRNIFARFVEADGTALRNELLSYERKVLLEGTLVKVRLSKRQRRILFLFSDVLLYAKPTAKGCVLKGRIKLHDGARVEGLPSTADVPHSFAIIERGGKGYTWLCEDADEREAWLKALRGALADGAAQCRVSSGFGLLAHLPSKPLAERLAAVRAGGVLTKYNRADGKSKLRWVYVERKKGGGGGGAHGGGEVIRWGDQKTRDCRSEMRLADATALLHGAKSSNFFKQKGTKTDGDWACLSIVFKGRTLDFAATTAADLLDWYLALASLMPASSEPLLDEPTLRQQMGSMGLGAAGGAASSSLAPAKPSSSRAPSVPASPRG